MTLVARYSLIVMLGFIVGCGKDFNTQDLIKTEHLDHAPAETDTPPEIPYEKVGEDLVRVKPLEHVAERIRLTDMDEKSEPALFQKVRGGLDIRDLKMQFDQAQKKMTVSGDVYFTIQDQRQKFSFQMQGSLKDGKVDLTVHNGSADFKANFQALATCFSDNCDEYFIDFLYYVHSQKLIYIDQVFPEKIVRRNTSPQAPKKKPEEKNSEAAPPTPLLPPAEDKRSDPAPALLPSIVADVPPVPDLAPVKSETPREEKKLETKPELQPEAEKEKKVTVEVDDEEPEEHDDLESAVGAENLVAQGFVGTTDDDLVRKFVALKNAKDEIEKEATARQDPPQEVRAQPQTTPAQDTPKKKASAAPSVPEALKPPVKIKPLDPQTETYPEKVAKILEPLAVGRNQAQGRPDKGSLRNAVELTPLVVQLGPLSGIRVMGQENRLNFGTSELVSSVLKMGQWIHRHVPNFLLDVRTMAAKNGGKLKGHASHQNGLDADIGYIFDETNQTQQLQRASMKGVVKKTFQVEKQWELFKALFATDQVEFILVSRPVKKAICDLVKETGELTHPNTSESTKKVLSKIADVILSELHDTHFHIRMKCGPEQKACFRLGLRPLEPCRVSR